MSRASHSILDAVAKVQAAANQTAPEPVVYSEFDRTGRRRSPATYPDFRKGISPNSKGKTYEPSPYTEDEVRFLLDACQSNSTAAWRRLSAWMAFQWRTGLRISESLDLVRDDLNAAAMTVTVRHGKGDKRRIVGMDQWGWDYLEQWVTIRRELPHPDGHVFCICEGPTKGERWSASGVRQMLAKLKDRTGFEKRLAPHQFRHTLAVSLVRESTLLPYISAQLGHANISTTHGYLRGLDPRETIEVIAARPVPFAEKAR